MGSISVVMSWAVSPVSLLSFLLCCVSSDTQHLHQNGRNIVSDFIEMRSLSMFVAIKRNCNCLTKQLHYADDTQAHTMAAFSSHGHRTENAIKEVHVDKSQLSACVLNTDHKGILSYLN